MKSIKNIITFIVLGTSLALAGCSSSPSDEEIKASKQEAVATELAKEKEDAAAKLTKEKEDAVAKLTKEKEDAAAKLLAEENAEKEKAASELEEANKSTMEYLIKNGDTLAEIAKDHGVPLEDLISLNPQVKNPDVIFTGTKVTVK